MADYSTNISVNVSSSGPNYISDLISNSISTDEAFVQTIKVPNGTSFGAGDVSIVLTGLSQIKLIIVEADAEVQMRFNAEIFDQTVRKVFVYDGSEVTTLKFANSSGNDTYVHVKAFG